MRHIRIGDYDCYSLSDGCFVLDGGAMFGIVPKNIWGGFYESDEENRIRLGLTSLLISGKGITLLIEGGIGQAFKNNEKLESLYGIEESDRLETELNEAGFTTDKINLVTYSHLHWDHAGPATKIDSRGNFIPRFPNARYLVQRGEWGIALSGDPATKASYLPETLTPLENAGQLDLIDGDYAVNEEIALKMTGGHTAHHMVLILKSKGDGIIFWGDLIPTSQHIHIPHIMAYDRYPLDTHRMKSELLQMTCAENMISAFPHDLELGFGKIGYNGKKYSLLNRL